MDLKDFISQTLFEIQEGVQEAINRSKSADISGAINPVWKNGEQLLDFDYTRFDHFHVNSATGGGGLDEVLQVLSGGGVNVRQHLPDEGEFVVTIDCPAPESGWLLTYDGGRPHIGSFSSAQPGTKVLVQAIGPPQWEVTYVES